MTAKQRNCIEYKTIDRCWTGWEKTKIVVAKLVKNYFFLCEPLFFAVVARRKNKSALFLLEIRRQDTARKWRSYRCARGMQRKIARK